MAEKLHRMIPTAYVLGGGTYSHVRPHMSLCAPSYGGVAKSIYTKLAAFSHIHTDLILSKMADPAHSVIETAQDVMDVLQVMIEHPATKLIVQSMAICDFDGLVYEEGHRTPSGKDQPRLESRQTYQMELKATPKILPMIKKARPDITVVGFKTTAGATVEEQVAKSIRQINECGCDYVFANDVHTRVNVVVTKGMYVKHPTREDAITGLCTSLSEDMKYV